MKLRIEAMPITYPPGYELRIEYRGHENISIMIPEDCPPAELAQRFYALSQAIFKDERLLADSSKPYRKQEKQ